MKQYTMLLRTIVSIALLGATPLKVHAADPSLVEEVRGQDVFTTPVEWVGEREPSPTDSAVLLEALKTFEPNGIKAGFDALEGYLEKNPQSSWAPSVRTHLAERYRIMGRYSAALKHWEAAWEASKGGTDDGSRQVAGRALSGWMRLLGSVGQKARLEELLAEAEKRDLFSTSYAPLLRASREGLSVMKGRPGESYRCGSLALAQVMKVRNVSAEASLTVGRTPSPDGGFQMSQLLALAASNRFEMEAVQRTEGDQIPVPSVVHWKLDHYAAILEAKNGRYKVIDPTFGGIAWIDGSIINEEASGYFLVPAADVPPKWRRLTRSEATVIRGKGYTYTADDDSDDSDDSDDDEDEDDCDPPEANDGPEGGGEPCPPEFGMPEWRISDPNMTLWVHDVPLFYRDSRGGWIKLRLSYKHRSVPRADKIASFGPNWECNWIGFVEQDAVQPDTVKNNLAGGGKVDFATNGTRDYWTSRRLVLNGSGLPTRIESAGKGRPKKPFSAKTSGSSAVGDWTTRAPSPSVSPVGGTDNLYGFPITYPAGIKRYMLTNRIDQYGRSKSYGYVSTNINSSIFTRLLAATDKDKNTSLLSYTNATFPRLVTSVTDPYGRSAHFRYDSVGRLTNIVDTGGLSSSFKYDASGAMTNMVTPYGTNSFRYFDYAGEPGYWSRGLEVTEPTGEKQLRACLKKHDV